MMTICTLAMVLTFGMLAVAAGYRLAPKALGVRMAVSNPFLGEQKILMVLTYWDDEAWVATFPEFRREFYQQALLGAQQPTGDPWENGSLNTLIHEASAGRTWVSGFVTEWLRIDGQYSRTAVNDIPDKALAAAVERYGLNPADYDYIMTVAPWQRPCETDTHGKIYFPPECGRDVRALGHEFGHTMGLSHDRLYSCPDDPFDVPERCTVREYGGKPSIMGSGFSHYHALQKLTLGWLDSAEVKTVTGNGEFLLEPLEAPSRGIKLLRIQRGVTASSSLGSELSMDYHQPIGYGQGNAEVSEGLPTSVYDGAVIHAGSYSLDLQPANLHAVSLSPGMILVDPSTGTQVAVENLRDFEHPELSRLRVRVTSGKADLDPPSISIISPQPEALISGETQLVAVVSDPAGLETVDFVIDGQIVASFTEANQVNGRFSFILDTATFANGTSHSFDVVAVAISMTRYSSYVFYSREDQSLYLQAPFKPALTQLLTT